MRQFQCCGSGSALDPDPGAVFFSIFGHLMISTLDPDSLEMLEQDPYLFNELGFFRFLNDRRVCTVHHIQKLTLYPCFKYSFVRSVLFALVEHVLKQN
jgi:hypothetical protein